MSRRISEPPSQARGFTLVELLVVLAIVALLLSLAAPRYLDALGRAEEAVLQTNVRLIREAIDKYRGDTGSYPQKLGDLVTYRYLRTVPMDPLSHSDQTWVPVPHPDGQTPGVYDVRSGFEGRARDGSVPNTW